MKYQPPSQASQKVNLNMETLLELCLLQIPTSLRGTTASFGPEDWAEPPCVRRGEGCSGWSSEAALATSLQQSPAEANLLTQQHAHHISSEPNRSMPTTSIYPIAECGVWNTGGKRMKGPSMAWPDFPSPPVQVTMRNKLQFCTWIAKDIWKKTFFQAIKRCINLLGKYPSMKWAKCSHSKRLPSLEWVGGWIRH